MSYGTAASIIKRSLLMGTAISLSLSGVAQAQTEDGVEDEIITTGTIQQTIEESLTVKRNTTVVSDALVGAEIGDLPDLSIAESLERITGVTSDRFKGGASELSIRGLGAFLGSSVFNGREITSGSDGRDVNFGQFPSELIGGTQVFKSQQASFVEGGVAGIIELQTLRPLDYGKKRIQVQGQLGYSDYESRVDDGEPWNTRLTGSFVDQFETGAGDIGISIGAQIRRDTAPEDIYTSSSNWRPCNTIEGVDRSNNCAFLRDSSGNPSGASDTYFVSNQYIYRALQTEADRDAVMGNIQWQPNAQWDVNLDFQWSDRRDIELRHNLVIADGRRDIVPITIAPSGALQAWQTETRFENQSVWRERTEEYNGLGLNVEWQGERLTLTGDVGYSKTERRQDEKDMRIRTRDRARVTLDYTNSDIPNLTIDDISRVESRATQAIGPFSFDNFSYYEDGARARRRLENIDDEVLAFRVDGDYELGGDVFKSVEFGTRIADRKRINDDGIDETLSLVADYFDPAVVATRRDTFPVQDLFAGANTNVRGITWATWNPEELFRALTGSDDAGLPTGSTLSFEDADIQEKTQAFYIMGNFENTLFGKPAFGNVGVRAVRTEIESLGIDQDIVTSPSTGVPGNIVLTGTGPTTINVQSNDFWNFLPSANLVIEVADDKLLRFAAYRAIARPDPGDMAAGVAPNEDNDGFVTVSEGIRNNGNPFLEPLESDNFDVSLEWYKTESSSISAAFYYKKLRTGIENQVTDVTLNIDGTDQTLQIIRQGNSDESSTLWGLEFSLQHQFENLPGVLSGLGVELGYNYANSDFEVPDPTAVDSNNPLALFVEPANISGFSDNNGNLSVFWENDILSMRLAYKFRTEYYKPFRVSPLRYTEDQDFLDFQGSLDLGDNLEFRFAALNILDEPNIFNRPTRDSFAQADYSGSRVFLGLRGRF